MAQIIWTEPALKDLETIAEYIELDKPTAARQLIRKIFLKMDLLGPYPNLGTLPPELRHLPYRQILVPPCRIFYRKSGLRILVIAVMRSERSFSEAFIQHRDPLAGH